MEYRITKNKLGEEIKVPVYDVRESQEERETIKEIVKLSNGNMSKHIPAKYGFGMFGPKKY